VRICRALECDGPYRLGNLNGLTELRSRYFGFVDARKTVAFLQTTVVGM
jgi:hypothetical protein